MSIEIIEENFNPTVIKVMGIGGGGCNAIDRMIHGGMEHISFIAANTDAQALSRSRASHKIQLGLQTTRGLGAGADPSVGRQAAEEQLPEIESLLKGTDVLFLTTGMGGGTGTGATPVIAKAARAAGCLTIAVVTKPFHFEMGTRMHHALAGIEDLKEYVDTLIVIPNQNLLNLRNRSLSISDAFHEADSVLMEGVRGISDLILKSGFVNVDFADIKTVMSKRGKAMLSVVEITHDMPPQEIATNILNNPLLEKSDITEAKAILLNISYGKNVLLQNIDKIVNAITEKIEPHAICIHGFIANPDYDQELKITMIATGLSDSPLLEDEEPARTTSSPHHREREQRHQTKSLRSSQYMDEQSELYEPPANEESAFSQKEIFTFAADRLMKLNKRPDSANDLHQEKEATQTSATSRSTQSTNLQKFNGQSFENFSENDLEVPAFLRTGKKLDL